MRRRRENNKIEGKYLNCVGGNKKLREILKLCRGKFKNEEGIKN